MQWRHLERRRRSHDHVFDKNNEVEKIRFGQFLVCLQILEPENTHFVRESITVQLTSSFICLDSAALLMLNEQHIYLFGWIQTSQTWYQLLCLCWMNNIFTCLVESKPVKQEFNYAVILPPFKLVSMLCSNAIERFLSVRSAGDTFIQLPTLFRMKVVFIHVL